MMETVRIRSTNFVAEADRELFASDDTRGPYGSRSS